MSLVSYKKNSLAKVNGRALSGNSSLIPIALDLISNPTVRAQVLAAGRMVVDAAGRGIGYLTKRQASIVGPNQSLMSSLAVSAPVSMTTQKKVRAALVNGSPFSGDGRVRVKHSEYLRDINGSIAYAVTAFAVNPGLSSTFPWLSIIAANYESYKFNSLSFRFETQKSTATSGTVLIAADYEASDADPINKQELMSFHGAVRTAPWAPVSMVCDKRDLLKFGVQRYVRTGSLAANLDVKTYDVADLLVATQGMADATAVGELYVDYDIELITPQINQTQVLVSSSARIASGGTVSQAAPFGDAATQTGGLDVSALNATLTFNRVGQYYVSFTIVGTVVTNTSPTITGTATVGGALVNLLANAAATVGSVQYRVQVNNIGETMIFNCAASATTITSSITRIAPYAYSIS